MNKKENKKNKVKKSDKRSGTQRTKVPAAYGYISKGTGPKINGSDRVIIRRRELVGTATNGATTGFALTPLSAATPGYDLNPSAVTLFPWLSRIAPCYERFRFNRVRFHFQPSQPTSTAGRFYAAVDYDYDDVVATTKQELMGNVTSVESPVWQECTLDCNPASLNRELPYRYVSCTGRTAMVDQRTSFAGFMMCAFDTPTTNLLMDIYVDYEVEFVTPIFDAVVNVDAETNGSLVAAANVTVAAGTQFLGRPLPSPRVVTTESSPVRVVTPGVNGVPTLTFGIGGTTADATRALDISNARGKGKIDLETEFLVTGQTPATIMNNVNLTECDWYGFDGVGNYLGSLVSSPTIYKPSTFTTVTGSKTGEVSVASKSIKSVVSTTLGALMTATPTLRYIVPLLFAYNAAFGAGESAFGFNFRREL